MVDLNFLAYSFSSAVLCVLFSTLPHTTSAEQNEQQLDSNKSNNKLQLLSNIQDVELLTDFLLLKNNFSNPSSTQQNLQTFAQALKNVNHQNSPKLNCNDDNLISRSSDKAKQICQVVNQCPSTELLSELVIDDSNSNATLSQSIVKLCPLLLFAQNQEQYCSISKKSQPQIDTSQNQHKSTSALVWAIATLSVTIVSLCSLSGVLVLPFLKSEVVYDNVIAALQGMAVGSLVGSALFHLIPQAFDLVASSGLNHGYLWKAMSVFGGIYMFYLAERAIKIYTDYRKQQKKNKKQKDSKIELNNHVVANNTHEVENAHAHTHHGDQEIATIAWMIILGDGLHNFIDGITIGAAFSRNILDGISISLACFFEEFPHELGDFSILLSSGMSMRKALSCNFLSACTCYLGMVFGILIGDLSGEASSYVFALAGGMFLYISLVDMVGELSRNLEVTGEKRGQVWAALMFSLQNFGMLAGIGIVFALAMFGGRIQL